MHFSGFNDATGIVDSDSGKCPSCKPEALSIFIHSGTMMTLCTGTKAYTTLHCYFLLNTALPASDTPSWIPNSITVETQYGP